MEQIVSLRPFVPAKDFAVSKRFYQALGFAITVEDPPIAILKAESFSFILQDFYVKEFAENFMMQMLVRNVDEWWAWIEPLKLPETFGVRAPKPPAMQPWGMKVGFLVDPSSVLWHVAETMF